MPRRVDKHYGGHEPRVVVSGTLSRAGCTCGWEGDDAETWLDHFQRATGQVITRSDPGGPDSAA